MEAAVAVAVVGASGGAGSGGARGKDGEQQPSARRDVREWQRVDAATGAVERARIQSDRWATRTAAGQQRCYGKVVASSVRDAADGRPEAQSLRQVEVFRQRGPQGSIQVVRASSSTTTSSSSTSPSTTAAAAAAAARLQLAFDNLQLPLHPLDVGPQRTRASVARSGSLSSRRPPTRQLRAIAAAPATVTSADSDAGDGNDESTRKGPSQPGASEEDSQVDSLTAQVSRICGQLHAEARRAALGERDGDVPIEEPRPQAPHAIVTRRRSNSIEDLQADESGRLEENKIWDRASHVRRSLQFPSKPQVRESSPRPQSLAVGRFFSEDSKLCEGGKLKGLEAFENILRRGANIADSVNKSLTHDREDSDASSADSLAKHLRSGSIMDVYMRRNSAKGSSASSASKRHSFVTVESLKEVRERLRPLNSPSDEDPKAHNNIFKFPKDDEENDDGIVSDDHVKHPDSESGSEMTPSKVKSYILGMEILANNNKNGTRKPILGTGSLESRTSSRTSSSGTHRSEEWYNRRKSYGFEQVHAADVDNSRSNRLWEKNKVESSTDSGICRSSEAVSGLPWNRTSPTKIEEGKSLDFRKSENLLNIGHSIQIKQDNKEKILEDNEKEEESPLQQRRKTVVTLRNEGSKSSSNFKSGEDGSIVVHNSIIKDSSTVSMNDYRTSVDEECRLKPIVGLRSVRDFQRQSNPVTITIPIISGEGDKENNEIGSKHNLFRLSAETNLRNERSAFTNGSALKDSFKRGTWNGGEDWKKSIDNEMKRHSIAVDESKYVREGIKRFSNLHDSASKELANVSTSELVKRFAAMNNGMKDDGIFSNDKFNNNSHTTGFNVSFVQNGDGLMIDDQNKKHKRVEFCKTEVHFAAESGRVNIVETDEKPPPSNPIRRRRRNSAAASIGDTGGSKSNLPEIRFGDSPYEKQLLGGNETTEVTETPSAPILLKPEPTRPTVLALGAFQKDIETEDHLYAQVKPVFTSAASNSKESTLSSSCEETTSEHVNVTGLTNEQMPRSILKNNRKPKPFILSSSNDSTLESSDNQEDKWAVRLKPLHVNTDSSPTAMWRSTVTLRSTAFDGLQSSPTERHDEPLSSINTENNVENELQRMLKQLRPAGQRKSTSETDFSLNVHSSPVSTKKNISETSNNSVQVTVTSPEAEPLFSGWSVADRVKQVEEMKHSSVETKGYSTRVNFGSGEATVVESGSSDDQQNLSLKPTGGPSLFQKSDKCKPMWLRREEKKQELQDCKTTVPPCLADAKFGKKGLVVRIGKSELAPKGEVHPGAINSPDSSGSDFENRYNTKTTTITIDMRPPLREESVSVSDLGKIKPEGNSEHLQSPSLIMKTIAKPTNYQPSTKSSPTSTLQIERPLAKKPERLRPPSPEKTDHPKSVPSQLAALKELYYSGEFSDDSEQADEEVRSYMSGDSGGGGGAVDGGAGVVAPLSTRGGSPESRRGRVDDSGSVVSGSWSRVRAFRTVQQMKNHQNTEGSAPPVRPARSRPAVGRSAPAPSVASPSANNPDDAPTAAPRRQPRKGSEPAAVEAPHSQVVTMSTMLPSYDPNRLRRVETLVSTRSGQPKITSIALRYEGDEPDDRQRTKTSSHSTTNNHGFNSAWKNLEPAPSHSHLPPRRDEKVDVGFTYYKPKEIPKEQPLLQDDRRDKTFKIEKHANQLQIEEVLREKDSSYRGSLFSSERRSNSSTDYHKRSSSPSKRPSAFLSPTTPTERERERYLSPSPKPFTKPATYFGEHSSPANSTFSNTYQKELHRKSNENSRSFERKCEENIHLRTSANSSISSVQKSVSPSNHKRSTPEKSKKGDERLSSEGRRRSFESPSRSQGPTRGRSLSPTKRVEPKKVQPPPEPEGNDYDSPIYENIDDLLEEPPSVRRAETDSAILEELTRAADQILQAVNGYTDEDSRASSDDDDLDRRHRRGRRGGRPAERMTTIDEAPARRASASSSAAVTSRRSQQQQQRLARQCTRLAAHNSSTSSIESVTRESPQRRVASGSAPGAGARALLTRERMVVEETRRKACSAPVVSAPSAGATRGRSRAARLLQRASSRELLLDARASSSEDATSGAEALPVRKLRCARRVRASSSSAAKSSSQAASASSSTRRTSPAVAVPQQSTAATTTAAGTGVTGAARTKRRETHDPKARSHAVRAEDGRRRVSGRREESDVTRPRGSRPTGLHHQHPTSSAVITSSSSSRRATGLQQRRSTGAAASRTALVAMTGTGTATTTTGTAAATAAGPSHAVAKKPSSSRNESLAHSNKISK